MVYLLLQLCLLYPVNCDNVILAPLKLLKHIAWDRLLYYIARKRCWLSKHLFLGCISRCARCMEMSFILYCILPGLQENVSADMYSSGPSLMQSSPLLTPAGEWCQTQWCACIVLWWTNILATACGRNVGTDYDWHYDLVVGTQRIITSIFSDSTAAMLVKEVAIMYKYKHL